MTTWGSTRRRWAQIACGDPRNEWAQRTDARATAELQARYGIAAKPKPVNEALVSLCHVLFNTNEFVYVD